MYHQEPKGVDETSAVQQCLPKPIQDARSVVERADHSLDPRAFAALEHLFALYASRPSLLAALKGLAPNYGRREFLLVVDRTGAPAFPSAESLTDLRDTAGEHPVFHDWFQESQIEGRPVLLIARWLCHLLGFRHRVVYLFLDHPTVSEYTLLQVRAFDKPYYPGCFDVPVAGHVVGLQRVEEALQKELDEELGLGLERDITPPTPIGSHEVRTVTHDPEFYNVDLRVLYRSRLRPGALERIRFKDGEVAALVVFRRSKVQVLLETLLERVASGLADSWQPYVDS
jgi:hypothetical protein